MSVITLTLPYFVSVNAYWLQSGKRRYISKRGVEFKRCVKEIWEASNHKGFGSAPVELSVMLFPRDKRLMDIDNAAKCIYELNKSVQSDMPVASTIYEILWEQLPAEDGFKKIEGFLI